jgi:hypothetical protein
LKSDSERIADVQKIICDLESQIEKTEDPEMAMLLSDTLIVAEEFLSNLIKWSAPWE